MKKRGGAEKPCPALSAIFDKPSTLADRLRRRDPRTVSTLDDLANILSAEKVGSGVKSRFLGQTDQQAGKLLKALLPLAADKKIGGAMKIIFAACLEELQQK